MFRRLLERGVSTGPIAEPQAERMMLHSMQKFGQLTPVVTCRIVPGEHELLDGFKRLKAGRQLGFGEEVKKLLFKWLNRRGKRGCLDWQKFWEMLKRFPLPEPRIKVRIFGISAN